MEKCTGVLGQDEELDDTLKGTLRTDYIDAMASKGLKVLAYGYKNMSIEDYRSAITDDDDDNFIENPKCRERIETGLTYVGTFGMEDPLRDSVK